MFYWSKGIDEGIPTKSCANEVKDDVSMEFMKLGLTSSGAAGLLLLIFILQYCLWRKYKGDSMNTSVSSFTN